MYTYICTVPVSSSQNTGTFEKSRTTELKAIINTVFNNMVKFNNSLEKLEGNK